MPKTKISDDFTSQDRRRYELFAWCLYKLGLASIDDVLSDSSSRVRTK